jgi:hypothetical protein
MIKRSIILSLLFGLAVVVYYGCGGGEEDEPDSPTASSGTPEITWTSTGEGFQIVVDYHYVSGFPAGYTAYARFENTGKSGSVPLVVSVLEGSTVKGTKDVSFSVAAGKEYTILINGGGGATPQINEFTWVHVNTWKVRVESDRAVKPWEAVLVSSGIYNSLNPFTLGSVELQTGLVTP